MKDVFHAGEWKGERDACAIPSILKCDRGGDFCNFNGGGNNNNVKRPGTKNIKVFT